MIASIRRRLGTAVSRFPALLARLGVVDREKGEEAFDLAVPVMVTGSMRTILRVADFFMVSLALGPAAVAGLELGFQYYFVPFGLALALSSGTISVVSRAVGAGRQAEADLAVKQSVWLSLLLSVPITVLTWRYAPAMVDVLTDDPATIGYGATYLRIVMVGVAFRFFGLIGSRSLAGAGDTRTPMYVRTVSVPTNVALNALLIFGLGPFPRLGVAGAALGTVIANALAAALFGAVLLSGRFPVRLRPGGPQFDRRIAAEVVRVGTPIGGMRLAQSFGRFPFLFVLSVLGTEVVAAFAIGRRVILLAIMPAWGYSTAASTLVGQSLGAGNDEEADDYGWQTLRIALATQLLVAAAILLLAGPIASVFGAGNVGLTATFIRVFALGIAGFSVSRTLQGGLRGAGDTRWPFYGTAIGNYLVRLPIAALALPVGFGVTLFGVTVAPGLGLGLPAVFLAILGDYYARGAVNWIRFRSGRWKTVAHRSELGD